MSTTIDIPEGSICPYCKGYVLRDEQGRQFPHMTSVQEDGTRDYSGKKLRPCPGDGKEQHS